MNFPRGLMLLAMGLIFSTVTVNTAWCLTQASLLDGREWQEINPDSKILYIKGIGNMADFETNVKKQKKGFCPSAMLVNELKKKSIESVVKEIDQYYQENPQKLQTAVIEVIYRRVTKLCPPE